MQLLKYMACIWAEYEKTFLSERGKISKNKSFKCPPIIPVVYYEGKKEWTADMYLRDRIMFSDILRPYIPDFKYIVVRNHDFSDEELLAREDEMSLLMLINKFQTADDITNFRDIEKDKIDSIIHNSSDQVIDIIAAVVRSLCTKIHISAEEWRKLGEKERQKAKEEQQKAKEEQQKRKEEQQKRIEEQQKRKEEQQKIKRMSMTILKAFFDDLAEYDMELIKSVIDSTDDTNRIVSWTDATENCSDKTALYNEIIGK